MRQGLVHIYHGDGKGENDLRHRTVRARSGRRG